MKYLVTVLLILIPSIVLGQTTNTILWDYDAALTEVQTYTQTIKVDNTVVATSVSCIAKVNDPTETTCSVVIPVLSAGVHTLTVTASKSGYEAEMRVSGLNPSNGPKQPGSPRIGTTIIINIP